VNSLDILEPQHPNVRLDVARGVAALVVFAAHIGQILFWRLLGPASAFAVISGIAARHAVLVFFLLSGHLITKSAVSNIRRNGSFAIADYSAARIARIYPPLLGAVAVCLLAWSVIHGLHLPGAAAYSLPGDLYRVRDSFTLSAGEIFRALTIRGGMLEADGPLWSLFIEVQIYAVVMAIAALWRRDLLPKIAAAIIGLAALALLRDSKFYMILWAMGAATAFVSVPRGRAVFIGAAALIAAACVAIVAPALFSQSMDTPAGQSVQLLCCLFYASALFFAYPAIRYPARLVATANFSYSLYVIHWPLLLLTLSLSQNWIGHSVWRAVAVTCVAAPLILAFVVAAASWLERPDQFKRLLLQLIPTGLSRRTVLGLYLVGGIAAVSAASAKVYLHVRSCEPRFDENYAYMPAAATPTIGRVILIPGMDGSAANFLAIPLFRKWADGLAAMGADVVVLNTPIPKACWFKDGGTKYQALFLQELDDVTAAASAAHGRAAHTMIAGVSYGGIHAMMGYAARPRAFVGWEASLSVTKLAALEELQDAGPVPAFDPFAEMAVLKGSQGYLTWGGKDLRVDHRLAEALYRAIRSPAVVGKGYAWLGHETTALTVSDALADARRQLTARPDRLSGR
jgi:peptidoglycan/LPS O-acetylase OafA/YrhL